MRAKQWCRLRGQRRWPGEITLSLFPRPPPGRGGSVRGALRVRSVRCAAGEKRAPKVVENPKGERRPRHELSGELVHIYPRPRPAHPPPRRILVPRPARPARLPARTPARRLPAPGSGFREGAPRELEQAPGPGDVHERRPPVRAPRYPAVHAPAARRAVWRVGDTRASMSGAAGGTGTAGVPLCAGCRAGDRLLWRVSGFLLAPEPRLADARPHDALPAPLARIEAPPVGPEPELARVPDVVREAQALPLLLGPALRLAPEGPEAHPAERAVPQARAAALRDGGAVVPLAVRRRADLRLAGGRVPGRVGAPVNPDASGGSRRRPRGGRAPAENFHPWRRRRCTGWARERALWPPGPWGPGGAHVARVADPLRVHLPREHGAPRRLWLLQRVPQRRPRRRLEARDALERVHPGELDVWLRRSGRGRGRVRGRGDVAGRQARWEGQARWLGRKGHQ